METRSILARNKLASLSVIYITAALRALDSMASAGTVDKTKDRGAAAAAELRELLKYAEAAQEEMKPELL
jgi:hypothetical protein